MNDAAVWLEDRDGKRWPIAAACAIGRATSNDVMIDDGRVSRRHALIHRQDDANFFVVDLGSGNGTYLDGRRVATSTRLLDGNTLTIGPLVLTFRQTTASQPQRRSSAHTSEQTIIQIKNLPAWLLVADIKGSTALAQRLPPEDLALLFGKWMAACKEIIEAESGTINKYLGDGFLAYWYVDKAQVARITAALEALVGLQRGGAAPPFRLALHMGTVAVGGGGSSGEDSLSGTDVIQVFRMEKLAADLKRDVLLSERAREAGGSALKLRDEGLHVLPGFDAVARRFFSLS